MYDSKIYRSKIVCKREILPMKIGRYKSDVTTLLAIFQIFELSR